MDVAGYLEVAAGLDANLTSIEFKTDTAAVGDELKAVRSATMVGAIQFAMGIMRETLLEAEFPEIPAGDLDPVHREDFKVDVPFFEIEGSHHPLTGDDSGGIGRGGARLRQGGDGEGEGPKPEGRQPGGIF